MAAEPATNSLQAASFYITGLARALINITGDFFLRHRLVATGLLPHCLRLLPAIPKVGAKRVRHGRVQSRGLVVIVVVVRHVAACII